ncbi:rhodanese-like domain-containing protein [Xanthovirga aplysinae]|uniref:rhodanese-like domain-containing protein n=1 Tax=Xanthovirga aplysinae TaxID=2529853 RepID=UPI0012BB9571|nr:rhodanese-like domain-containing protein [Xanthovirga aplysinae]MTI32951.1 rhodanese-like domain-containing protein [Xanthovirga aplysinae]
MFDVLKNLFGKTVDFQQLMNEGATIIDVRSSEEFNRGHLNGSFNIPLESLQNKLEKIEKYKQPIITCCRSGARSAIAASILKKADIEVYNGGSWEQLANSKT